MSNAAPIQNIIIDRPWQVVANGVVISHCKTRRTAVAEAAECPNASVRFVG